MKWGLRDPDTAADEIDPHQGISVRRRPVLLGLTTIGTAGVGGFSRGVDARESATRLSFKSSKVLVVTNASALSSVTIYYLDSDDARQMETISSLTNKISRDPLQLRYTQGNDQAIIQIKGRTSLVRATATGPTYRSAVTNSKAKRAPDDFNSPPEASFTVSTTEPEIGTMITFTSTATDPDFPEEQLTYDWDLDGDGDFETHGTNVSYTYESSDRVTVTHRVTDAFGETDTAQRIITPERSVLFERLSTLTPPTSAPGDGFGGSVSLDGDTALISGRGAEDFEEGDGIAHVFTRVNGTWTHQQKLTAPNRRQNDAFFAVQVSGDTALVNGSNTLREPRGAGWVDVFTRRGDTWQSQQRLTTPDPQVHDAFGASIDIDEDTIVVGASLDDNARPDGGTAHIFTQADEGWTLQQILTPTDADSRDRFGYSASVSGDTVLVGSIYEDEIGPASSNAGAAYVFTRDGTTWTQQQKLLVTDGEYDDYVGADVSLDGDTALVGTGGADAAYVFTRDGATWTQQQELTVADGSIDSPVSVDGDVALVAGTTEEYLGAIHVFTRSGSTWSHRQTLTGADIGQDDGLRGAFSLDDGTGLIGTSEEDEPGTAYIFG